MNGVPAPLRRNLARLFLLLCVAALLYSDGAGDWRSLAVLLSGALAFTAARFALIASLRRLRPDAAARPAGPAARVLRKNLTRLLLLLWLGGLMWALGWLGPDNPLGWDDPVRAGIGLVLGFAALSAIEIAWLRFVRPPRQAAAP